MGGLILRINNYFISNRNIHNFRNNQRGLGKHVGNLAKRTINNSVAESIMDSVSIDTGKQLLANRKLLSSKTEINGKNIGPLIANNNMLNLNKGSYYKLKINSGTTAIFTVSDNGNIHMPFSELGLDSNLTLAQSDYGEISKTSRLLSSLAQDGSAFLVRTGGYSNTEIKDILNNVGIKPGWFQINSDGKSNKFYMLDNGLIYPEYQVEAERRGFNERNWFKDGYTRNSAFIVEGKEYKLDENGHLNIPEGVGSLMDNTKIIK
jgi:hypothetical protein